MAFMSKGPTPFPGRHGYQAPIKPVTPQQKPVSLPPGVVHRQFNSPLPLYSADAVAETLTKQAHVLSNGAIGIDFRYLAAPNLAKSEVLKMLEAEEQTRQGPGERRGVLGRWGSSGAGPPRPPSTASAPTPGRRLMPGKIEWPPKASHIVQAPTFFTSNKGLKRVAWPPPPENLVDSVVEEAPGTYQAPLYNGTSQRPWENGLSNDYQHREVKSPQYQQHTAQQHQPVHQQVYRPVTSPPPPPPSTVILRQQTPISQTPAPVFISQPAVKRQEPIKMRGDQKWPPEHYKQAKQAEMIAAEQAAARARAAGKPRRVNRDYTAFFQQNALTPTYPGYKAPPGTQHYEEEGTSNL